MTTQTKQGKIKIREQYFFEDVFTSTLLKGLVLLLIIAFNAMILKNCFLLAAPIQSFSGNQETDAWLYGSAISVLMVIILFHERKWHNISCPGAITLYLNTLIMILYMHWFAWLLNPAWTMWLLGGLLILQPVLGLFILVVMLKRGDTVR